MSMTRAHGDSTPRGRFCLRTPDGSCLSVNYDMATGATEVVFVASLWLARLMDEEEAARVAEALPGLGLRREEWAPPAPSVAGRRR